MTRPDVPGSHMNGDPLQEMADRLFCRIQTAVPIEDNLLLMIEHALRTAHRKGQESMRERAAKLIEENSHRSCGRGMADSIRSLPTEPEDDSYKKCSHGIPITVDCPPCKRKWITPEGGV